MKEDELAKKVIGASIAVHKALGPGLLEKVYTECLAYKLTKEGLVFEKEKPIKVEFEDVTINCGFRLDFLIENKLVLEIKSVEQYHPIHLAQILTYLKLGDYRLGLLINFNVYKLTDGIKRVVNKFEG